MWEKAAVIGGITLITLVGFIRFPGHTYLQSDTQIYIPMLERIYNPASLPRDLVAEKPHLAFTIYDEVTLVFHRLGLSYEAGLAAQEIVFRAMQNAGVYLLAASMALSPMQALAVSAIAALGAAVPGPAVLLVEFEPIPRGFAVAMILLAAGLAARKRDWLASTAGAIGFLYHAPTTLPFWLLWRRKWLPPVIAGAALFLAYCLQQNVAGSQQFLGTVDPAWEAAMRLRASYTFVSTWALTLVPFYIFVWLTSVIAYWRIRPGSPASTLLFGLPITGLLSVPVSYLLLERMKWAVTPQVQPARGLLWVIGVALILGGAAAFRAKHWLERFLWFGFVFSIPLLGFAMTPNWPLSLGAAALATILSRWREELAFIPILALFLLAPPQHQPIVTADLAALIDYAREHTPADAMFAFPDAGRSLAPGVFRAQAVRSVYVDWKAGGQVNYFRSVGMKWWDRWTHPPPAGLIDYEVRSKPDSSRQPVYRNTTYYVYRMTPK